ncbi:hypothetical protein KCU78_g22493, partial [Aureobasidium melanogenum]
DNETLKPLHQLIRLPVPINDDQKITVDHFAPLTPNIKLFLSYETERLDSGTCREHCLQFGRRLQGLD